ncbi:MAG: hypothetical protein RL685_2623, partial [Pseudomonadota bacterium]
PSEFDAERWSELAAVAVASSESLLERMQKRVGGALPEARRRLESATAGGSVAEVGRALHDLHGLLLLIGATRAAEHARRAEEATAEGRIDAESTAALHARLDAVSAELAALASERTPPAEPGRGGPDSAF